MKKHTITLTTGEKFPVEITLGAMLLFKKETGKEATEADTQSLSELTQLLWCGAASASEVSGVKFDYTLQQFANRLTPAALQEWSRELSTDLSEAIPEGDDEKEGEAKKKAES